MTAVHHSPPFKPGDEVCRVKIQRLIGKGGQGFVYEGIHQFLKKPVAIKAIPNTLDSTRNLRERAEREAGILFDLQHPNVLRVTDADVTDEGVVCIVMEMLRGRSIRSLLHELHRVQVQEALLIGAQIADGVQVAHERQTIHRDLKPENVYIEPGNVVKVLDFGIAKILGPGAVTTQANLIEGTLQYMSPEHLQARSVTARSDVFALGCILYELLSGSTPSVIGLEGVTVQLAGWNQIMLIPPRLDTVVEGVPASVARAIQTMLAKEPDERPASMKVVSHELRALRKRYAGRATSLVRELWHDGAGAAPPIALKTKPAIATTTIPDAVGPREEGELQSMISQSIDAGVLPGAQATGITKPLPLLVRNESNPPEPTLILDPTPSTQTGLRVQPGSRGDRFLARKRSSAGAQPLQIRWRSVAVAAGLGGVLGTLALVASSWSSERKDAAAVSSASADDSMPAPAPPTALLPHSEPAMLDSAAQTPSPTQTLAETPVSPAPIAKRETHPQAISTPATSASAVSTKPGPRKVTPAANKLPFTGDDLIF